MSEQKKNPTADSKTVADTNKTELPEEFAQVLGEVPAEQREKISQLMFSSFSMINRVSPEMELTRKITGDHITSMMENESKAMDYSYRNDQHKMVFQVVVLLVVILAVIAIILLLKDSNPELMAQILIALISATLGAAGGYGVGRNRGNKE